MAEAEKSRASNEAQRPAKGASQTLLSVVIPIFNGTAYLPQLIDTLRKQQRVPDEVIFVDDGSTDGSGATIERLGTGLKGLKVIAQKNQGQAVARNTGLRQATGRYLAFLDVDDLPASPMYATLLDLAERDELDIAMGNAWNFYEGRKPDTLIYRDVPDTGVITGEKWFQERVLAGYMPYYCWMQIYRRSLIDRHGFTFPLADPHEDVVWVTETLLAARRFRFVPQPLHRYRKKMVYPSPPPVRVPGTGLVRHKVVEASMHNVRALLEIAKREPLQPLTRKLIRRDFVNAGCNLVKQIRKLPDPLQTAHYLGRVRRERFFPMLWRNAAGPSQHWRVFRYHLLSYLLAVATYVSLLRWRFLRGG